MPNETTRARAQFDRHWQSLTPIERLEFDCFADEQGWSPERRQSQRWTFAYFELWHGKTVSDRIAEMRRDLEFLESLKQ
ncbi:MAG: hypothetical protein AAFY15_04570 [Cyanobacteria bacterium J06648_11]